MSKKQTYKFGLLAEKISIIFLRLKGYKILEWRYKTYFGEIDIIAQKSQIIIAVEVKARKSKVPIEEILRHQQVNRIKKATQFFISQNVQFQNYDLRFDFIEVDRFLFPKHYPGFC